MPLEVGQVAVDRNSASRLLGQGGMHLAVWSLLHLAELGIPSWRHGHDHLP
jgi:hypothetical protein